MYILKFSFPCVGALHGCVYPYLHLSAFGIPFIFYPYIYRATIIYFFSVYCLIK